MNLSGSWQEKTMSPGLANKGTSWAGPVPVQVWPIWLMVATPISEEGIYSVTQGQTTSTFVIHDLKLWMQICSIPPRKKKRRKTTKNSIYSMKLFILDAALIRYSQLGHGLLCTLLFWYSNLLKWKHIAVVTLLWFGCLMFIISLFILT